MIHDGDDERVYYSSIILTYSSMIKKIYEKFTIRIKYNIIGLESSWDSYTRIYSIFFL